jgi:hypothetical protein
MGLNEVYSMYFFYYLNLPRLIQTRNQQARSQSHSGLLVLALVMALGLMPSAVPSEPQSSQPEKLPHNNSPSLWDQIKSGVKKGIQKNSGEQGQDQDIHDSWSRTGIDAHEWHGAVYTPLNPSSGAQFAGIFSHQNHRAGQEGRLLWPRVALTFVEYGGSLLCWKVRATIWASVSSSRHEFFQICNAKIQTTDDIGQQAYFTPMALGAINVRLDHVTAASIPNTGTTRTEGPNPPVAPWRLNIAYGDPEIERFSGRLYEMRLRLAWTSGYVNEDDLIKSENGSNLLTVHFNDPRMWIAGFDKKGNADNNDPSPR